MTIVGTKPSRYIAKEMRQKALLRRRAKIIVLYIGCGFTIIEIAGIMNLDISTICRDISFYFKKPDTDMILKSKI